MQFYVKHVQPPLLNSILCCPTRSKVSLNAYIGVLEHGEYELRVIAKRDHFGYWDTIPERLVETLRTAIKWWKTSSMYSEEELDALGSGLDEDGESFWSEMRDLGLTDEDFEGRD